MSPLSRVIRIFISSTFRDFAGERDILVRKIFPELRRRCRERQVELGSIAWYMGNSKNRPIQ